MGLEPTTFAVTGRRCNQLNYAPAYQLTENQIENLTNFQKLIIADASCED